MKVNTKDEQDELFENFQIQVKDCEIWSTGNSHVVTIPKDFVTTGQVDVGDKVTLILTLRKRREVN